MAIMSVRRLTQDNMGKWTKALSKNKRQHLYWSLDGNSLKFLYGSAIQDDGRHMTKCKIGIHNVLKIYFSGTINPFSKTFCYLLLSKLRTWVDDALMFSKYSLNNAQIVERGRNITTCVIIEKNVVLRTTNEPHTYKINSYFNTVLGD